MLTFIEIIQLQKYIIKQNEINVKNDKALFHKIEFFDNMAQSKIVYNDEIDDDEMKYDYYDQLKLIKLKSNKLFKKYVEYGSEYENILKSKIHNKITETMSHIDWIDDEDIDINIILITFMG